MTRSESSTASRIACVTNSTDGRSRSHSRSSSSRSSSRENSSSAPNGSSMSSSRGPCASARASATRCRIPPDSSPGWYPAKRAIPVRSRSPRTAASPPRCPASSKLSATFPATVRQGSRPGSWVTRPNARVARAAFGVSPEHLRAALGGRDQPGDDAQQRCLAAPARTDDRDELARLDRELDAVEGEQARSVARGVAVRDALDGDGGRRDSGRGRRGHAVVRPLDPRGWRACCGRLRAAHCNRRGVHARGEYANERAVVAACMPAASTPAEGCGAHARDHRDHRRHRA